MDALKTLSTKQLGRVYNRVLGRIGADGACDLPTLRVVNPPLYRAFRTLAAELRDRELVNAFPADGPDFDATAKPDTDYTAFAD